MTEYKFDHDDWFSHNVVIWDAIKPYVPQQKGRVFIEVGSFEGRSMVWIAENLMQPGDLITCIDTWGGGEEHSAVDMAQVEANFDHNRSTACAKVDNLAVFKHKSTSVEGLINELRNGCGEQGASFVYIDGSHQAKDVLTDACLAWQLLENGGVLVFDDYTWGDPRDALHRPKMAIDAFTNIFAEEINPLHVGYQYIVQKKTRKEHTYVG